MPKEGPWFDDRSSATTNCPYEISSYGTVRTYAQYLKMTPEAGLLEETLNEEKETDKKLTELAEKILNTLEQ